MLSGMGKESTEVSEMEQVQKIEGISPDMLWTFLIVLVGLATLFVLGDKVLDVFRKAHERRKQSHQLNQQDITDKIADKVIEKLNPELDKKFAEIDKRLKNDKENLDSHTRQLNAFESRVTQLENGNKALCHGMLALLELNPSLKNAQKAMRNYLIDGEYKEDNDE